MGLYKYQEEVAKLLQRGQSVILQAPTGSGKTRAALWPFLEAWDRNNPLVFPRKCIYSVPMRILAKHFEKEANKLITEDLLLAKNPVVSIQIGDVPHDRQFEADLIFTTIDQSLSSLLAAPYALSKKQRNLNVGAIIGSYLVFDEYHLFPTTETRGVGALGSTLTMLKWLKNITPFCLMTATFSSEMLTELKNLLGVEVVTISENELEEIETHEDTHQRKERRFQVMSVPLSAQAIVDNLAERVIVVCNRVDRAQRLYQELVDKVGQERVMLLHARFLQKDRNQLETKALQEFGKETEHYSPHPLILVATQVIEVGLDLSCQVLHSEIAPANAIIQRAGRCARRAGEKGQVFIYPLPPDENKWHLPYSQKLCEDTLTIFSDKLYNRQILHFTEEQKAIDFVHNEYDRKLLKSLGNREEGTVRVIENIMMLGDTSEQSDLIRMIDNRTLLVHDEPEQLGNPLAGEGFSLFRWSLKSKWKELEMWAERKELEWWLKYPTEVKGADIGQAEPEFIWKIAKDSSFIDLPLPLVIHPQLVAYDSVLGFRLTFETDGQFRTEPATNKKQKQRNFYTYQLESYEQHVSNMLEVYHRHLHESWLYVGRRLETALDLKVGAIEQAARLVIALHDVGKLDRTWQKWAHNYQKKIGQPVMDSFMIAHTLSETNDHYTIANQTKPTRPHHAAEGAAASVQILNHAAKKWANNQSGGQALFKAMLTAITRHHSSDTHDCKEYELDSNASLAITKALTVANLANLPTTIMPFKPLTFHNQLVKLGDDWLVWFLYFMLVRPLILSDHKSLER